MDRLAGIKSTVHYRNHVLLLVNARNNSGCVVEIMCAAYS